MVEFKEIVSAVEQVYDYVFVVERVDKQFIYRYASENIGQLQTIEPDYLGKTIIEANPPSVAAHVHTMFEKAYIERKPIVFKDRMTFNSFNEAAKTMIFPVTRSSGDVKYLLACTEKESQPETNAIDSVTGLPSFRVFRENLHQLLQSHSGENALLYVNIDQFKAIMESIGHARIDELLVEITSRLLIAIAGEDCSLTRVTGDEFMLSAPSCTDPIVLPSEFRLNWLNRIRWGNRN